MLEFDLDITVFIDKLLPVKQSFCVSSGKQIQHSDRGGVWDTLLWSTEAMQADPLAEQHWSTENNSYYRWVLHEAKAPLLPWKHYSESTAEARWSIEKVSRQSHLSSTVSSERCVAHYAAWSSLRSCHVGYTSGGKLHLWQCIGIWCDFCLWNKILLMFFRNYQPHVTSRWRWGTFVAFSDMT